MMSLLHDLKGFGDILKSYIGLGLKDISEYILSGSVDRLDALDKIGRETSAQHLHLKDTIAFLESHKGLLQDIKSQSSRVGEDIRLFVDLAHARINDGGIDDRWNLTERIIQLAVSLPDGSEAQGKLTGALVKTLWGTLQHPPLSYLGDENEYRSADGSNNNPLYPKLGMAGTPYARSVTPETTGRPYPDPGEVFDKLLCRGKKPKEQPNQISSLLFYMAILIIHDLFRTGDWSKKGSDVDFNISTTSSYLDLSPLYGNSLEEQEAVRTMMDGKLKPDAFSEDRLVGFPPGVSALLVAFNRFHNHVAEKLKELNEQGRFTPNPRLSSREALKKVDHDLFNTSRLVTCGIYINIILSDYLRTILNLNYAPDSNWILDPRGSFPQGLDKSSIPAATGNQVSVEFNLIYHWHTCLSTKDENWTQALFQDLFHGKEVGELDTADFVRGLFNFRQRTVAQDPGSRTFGRLKREDSGGFATNPLASLIVEASNDVSSSFGPHQVPEVLRPVIMLSIIQARGWKVGTLNELRKFLGLKTHESFSDINSDPEIQDAMRSLYKDPNLVEMYPGILFEQPKESFYPGSGLCAGSTMTRAILSDAVALVRGDRFYTIGWTPAALTDWGFEFIKPDKPQDKLARGGKLHQVLDIAFPGIYRENSVLKLFPFSVPEKMYSILENEGVASKYDFPNLE